MNETLTNSAKSVFLNFSRHNSTRRFYIDVLLARKLIWKYKNPKKTMVEILKNINKFYYPSLKISKGAQIKKLFSKIDINIPKKGFIFSIDEYKTLNYENIIIDNISVDYSKILDNSINDLRMNVPSGNDEYCENQNLTFDAIELLINREIDSLKSSDRLDKDKFILFFENLKTSKASSFEEALQRILFFNQMIWQTGHALNGFGRLDKVLDEVYKKDDISEDEAIDLIKNFLKAGHSYFYYKSESMPGDTGQIIVLGGKESTGEYFSNDLTYLFIKAVKEPMSSG